MKIVKTTVAGLVLLLAWSSVGQAATASLTGGMMELGGRKEVAVQLEPDAETEVYGVEVRVRFDESLLRVVDVRCAGDLGGWSGPIYNVHEGGLLAVAAASAFAAVDPSELFVITFEAVGLGQSTLDLDRVVVNETAIQERQSSTLTVAIVPTEEESWGAWKALYREPGASR